MKKYLIKLILSLKAFVRPNAKIDFIYKLNEKSNILDVGCGNNSPFVTKIIKPKCFYTGIDIHDYNQYAKHYADEYLIVRPETFDVSISSLKRKYDVVISNHNIEHVNDREATLNAMISRMRIDGLIYLAFPCMDSIKFPSRKPTLNYYDDLTHKYEPPNYSLIVNILEKNNFEILYSTEKYQPLVLKILGFVLEPISKLIGKNLLGTWVYYGFESIIIAKRLK